MNYLSIGNKNRFINQLIIELILTSINKFHTLPTSFENNLHMLNVLVDKAIERSTSKLQSPSPIFTINYSTLKKSKQTETKQSKNKPLNINKIPKIIKGSEFVFQKLKSKTIEKFKYTPTQTVYLFSPLTNKKSIKSSSKKKDLPISPFENSLTPSRKQRNLPIQNVPALQDLKKLTLSPFMVHKKQVSTKSHSMYEKNEQKQPIKSLYLQYRQGLKNKTNKKVAFNKYYCQRRVSEGDNVNATNKTMINSSIQFENEAQENQYPQQQVNGIKNVSFINTIQYQTLPKQQVRPYKIDTSYKEKSRKTSLGNTEHIFVRTKKNKNTKDLPQIQNPTTISVFAQNRQLNKEPQQILYNNAQKSQKNLKARGTCSRISIRKVYTQKRTRMNVKDYLGQEFRQQFQHKQRDSYRPWSPIKTNPLFIHDQDLLFEQSKKFNIQLQQIKN